MGKWIILVLELGSDDGILQSDTLFPYLNSPCV